ncbi:MAG: MFS transporter [Actinomycetaceae bacterium]|nr:MFS transporter [Actinomycetaceae bacterium]
MTDYKQRRQIAAWAAWDAGGAGINAVATTFVFSVYLTSKAFGDTNYTSQVVSAGLSIAGIIVALTAPITGQRADRRGKGTYWLGVFSVIVVACLAAMVFVAPAPNYLWLGVFLLAAGTVFFEFASVNYYAMLPRISTKENIGRVSGIGWAAGYFSGIFLLLLLNFGIISKGRLVPVPDGWEVRVSMLIAAVWSLAFFLPVLRAVPGRVVPGAHDLPPESIATSYRKLWGTVKTLYYKSPHLLFFLAASAVFRDGLAGVFTFGGVLAAATFGFSPAEVLMFGVAANVIAGIFTATLGILDDKLGPKKLMIISLVCLVVAALVVFFLHDKGKWVFWVFGLFLCIWVGPAQSASRSFLARRIPEGNEGEVFGLYQTTGRAVTYLAPGMFSLSVHLGARVSGGSNATHFGILGIAFVLLLGLLMLIPVKSDEAHLAHINHEF